MNTTTTTKLAEAAREVTDAEVAFYNEHGWVKLERLISPELAAELLTAAKSLREVIQNSPQVDDTVTEQSVLLKEVKLTTRTTQDWTAKLWAPSETGGSNFFVTNIRPEPILSFTLSKSLGRVAYRMMNRSSLTDEKIGVRALDGTLWAKDSPGPGSGNETGFHQDYRDVSLDRIGSLGIWIALDEVTPEQGAMRFLDKSHRAGPLGPGNLLNEYPHLPEQYEFTPPLHYKPGDATVHNHLLVHGAPENSTTKTRWSYICAFFPTDANFTRETRFGYPEPFERFPLVYP